ncbi:MAG: DUF421 domain-containing protein, partial [Bifidobacteriaceae bacterium]|jgi:uncharacterized membrane protein YcaP (DUF421 family)|nr:DUF421 domain-containing protein [Bifidobacteriaceae bacterium]
LIALVVLFAWEHAVRLVTRRASWRYPLTSARLVLVDGQVDNAALKAARIRPADLWIRLRRAGVTQLADVRYGIIEGDGSVTVIRAGQEVSPELLEGIVGLPASS